MARRVGRALLGRELAVDLAAEAIEPSGAAIERIRRLSRGGVSRRVPLRLNRRPRATAALGERRECAGLGRALLDARASAPLA